MSTNIPRFVMPNGQEIILEGKMILGRSVECAIRLDDTIASRQHASVEVSGAQVTLTDLNSSNGTSVNETRVMGTQVLKDGDQVRIGSTTLVFRAVAVEAATAGATMSPVVESSTMVWQGSEPMTLIRGDGSEFGLNRTMVVGRSKENDIDLLEDNSASQRHAKFEVIAGQAVLSDLGSSNGTWLNDRKLSKPTPLKHGDRIRVGDSVFRLKVGTRPLAEEKEKSSSSGCMMWALGSIAVIAVCLSLSAVMASVFGVIALPSMIPTASGITVNTSGSATQQAALEQKALRALVQVIVPVGDPKTTKQYSTGSGSIISAQGYVITNFHVIADTKTGKMYNNDGWVWIGINLKDPNAAPDTLYRCQIVKTSRDLDIALLKPIQTKDGGALPTGLTFPFLVVGNSDAMKIGDPIAVLGFPSLGGDTPTFTRGTISGFLTDDDNGLDKGWFKTDAEINPGNSGGMAINAKGELIGVPTLVTFNRPNQATGKIGEIRPINFAADFVNAAR